MMRSLSTSAFGQPSETKLTFGARISSIVSGLGVYRCRGAKRRDRQLQGTGCRLALAGGTGNLSGAAPAIRTDPHDADHQQPRCRAGADDGDDTSTRSRNPTSRSSPGRRCAGRASTSASRPAIPTKNYQWGTMEGGSTAGYFAIRMKSDVIYETRIQRRRHRRRNTARSPGLFCGLILLTSIENGEPLAFINDGVLQHMRVGADGGIGVKYLANEDAEVVGMLGSGGMARTHMEAFTARAHASRSCRCSAPPGRTARSSAARWRRNTISRSRSATSPRTSTRARTSSPR